MDINKIIDTIQRVAQVLRRLANSRLVRRLLRLVMVVAVVALWTAGSDLFAANAGGALMAMAAAVTTAKAGASFSQPLTTGLAREAAPGLLRSEVDERIVKIRPSATPIDQISRLGGARHADSIEVDYYSVDTKAGQGKLGEGSTTAKLVVADGKIFSATETVMLPAVKDASGRPMVFYVKAVDDNELTVATQQTLGSGVTLAKDAVVVRMGRAAKELDVQSPLYNSVPTKRTNYCQIFKTQVEQSRLQRLADKEVGWTFSDQEEVAVMDMRMGMEKTFLFGMKARIDGDGGDDVWLTDGIWNQTANDFSYTTFNATALQDLMRKAFTGNAGSTRKVLVGGTDLIDALNRLDAARVLAGTDKETVWGVDFHKMVSKFGTLYVVHSEVFDACGGAGNGMVIDPEYLTKYTHIPFGAERLSLRKSGVRNTEAVVMTEASCLVLRYPNAHVRVIKG